MSLLVELDMDGVVADFIAGACAVHGRESSPYIAGQSYFDEETNTEADIEPLFGFESKSAFWKPMEEEWWANLPKTPECDDIVATILRYFEPKDVAVLSAPSRNLGSMPGKIRWLTKNIPFLDRQFIFAPSKKFCAGPGRILIDDRDKNTQEFIKAGGQAFLFPRPWNSRHEDEGVAVQLLDEYLCHLKKCSLELTLANQAAGLLSTTEALAVLDTRR